MKTDESNFNGSKNTFNKRNSIDAYASHTSIQYLGNDMPEKRLNSIDMEMPQL